MSCYVFKRRAKAEPAQHFLSIVLSLYQNKLPIASVKSRLLDESTARASVENWCRENREGSHAVKAFFGTAEK
jgi:hypothetical protein